MNILTLKQVGKQVGEQIVREYSDVAFDMVVEDQTRWYGGLVLSPSAPSSPLRQRVRDRGCGHGGSWPNSPKPSLHPTMAEQTCSHLHK